MDERDQKLLLVALFFLRLPRFAKNCVFTEPFLKCVAYTPKSVGCLRGDDFLSANLRCGFGSFFGCLLMRVPQLRVKARLAHSAGFTAVPLSEMMTTGWTIELRSGHRIAV